MDDNRDVELRFPPVPGHVRTARLVAVAVARRAGLDDIRLDEVRLAVGEACARAVRRCLRSGDPGPIVLVISDHLTDSTPGLRAEVWDDAPPAPEEDDEDDAPGEASASAGEASHGQSGAADGDVSRGRGEGAQVGRGPGGRAEVGRGRGEGAQVGHGRKSGGEPADVVHGELGEPGDAAGDDVPDDAVVIALLTGLADRVEVLDGTGGPGGRVRMTWTHRPKRTKDR